MWNCGKSIRSSSILTREGANINYLDWDGWTPLYHANSRGFIEIAREIEKYGGEEPSHYFFHEPPEDPFSYRLGDEESSSGSDPDLDIKTLFNSCSPKLVPR